MGKKRKHKIRQLDSASPLEADTKIELEENSLEIFEEYLNKTDWDKVAKEVSRKGKEALKEKKKPNKNKELKTILDLHGHTLREAKEVLDSLVLDVINSKMDSLSLKVITGRGLHSKDGPGVLAREIPLHLSAKWARRIVFIEESPANLLLGDIPLRGSFIVILDTREK